jgi:hypothetical protein
MFLREADEQAIASILFEDAYPEAVDKAWYVRPLKAAAKKLEFWDIYKRLKKDYVYVSVLGRVVSYIHVVEPIILSLIF